MSRASAPVLILCGGRGTRLRQRTPPIPKPLVEIGGLPIVAHVIALFAAQGFARFVLATGYLGDAIAEFVDGHTWPAEVSVECVDTGVDTPTGGRVLLARSALGDVPRLAVTYADGVADIDLASLLRFHSAHGALATVTVVRPRLPFGVARLAPDGRVVGFDEKPRSSEWINGGFFVFEPGVFSRLSEDSVLERAPLERLAADGQLHAYRHEGFWECLDTYKDAVALNDLWARGEAPWRGRGGVVLAGP